MRPATVLGISCFYHDAASALVVDGRIVAAAQEERFTRQKYDPRFPKHAILYCLEEAGLDVEDLDAIVFYDKPLWTLDRLISTYLAIAPRNIRSWVTAIPRWLSATSMLSRIIRETLHYEGTLLTTPHHLAHAASAYFPSPFDEAAILTIDGVGEWSTATYGVGQGNRLQLFGELRFPDSLGLLYAAFTAFCGFKVNSGEYKLMGLAPYGEPRYVDVILKELVDVRDDGSLRLSPKYFGYVSGLSMTTRDFARLFGGPPRTPEGPITQREMDLAASIQCVTETVVLRMAHHVHQITGKRNVCLAGGVALNCVANGRLLREGPFERVWVQPAAGDAGGALGAALAVYHGYLGQPRDPDPAADRQRGSFLGPAFSAEEIEAFLETHGYPYYCLPRQDGPRTVARWIAEGHVVGCFAGRMEFGPRALGARSILADPRREGLQTTLNLKIKRRESFRPFAPVVLADQAGDYFDFEAESPYMMFVAPVLPRRRLPRGEFPDDGNLLPAINRRRSDIPAVTHWDYSARLQTVTPTGLPELYEILREFYELTGCPVLVNTSFNVRGEPIVCTPQEAYRCFMRTGLDALYLQGYWLLKEEQPAWREPAHGWSAEPMD
jgi:carbamoyltransferase